MRTPVLSGHELVSVDALHGEYGAVSVCMCGWRSTPAGPGHARRRWEIHVDSTRAAASCFAAEDGVKRAQMRIDELARLREAARERRAAVYEARRRLAATRHAFDRGTEPTRYALPTLLECGRQMAGLSYANLWLAYFSLGGNLTPSELMSALRDSTLLPHWDLDLLALALNESFAESGLGRPLEYWRGRSDASS